MDSVSYNEPTMDSVSYNEPTMDGVSYNEPTMDGVSYNEPTVMTLVNEVLWMTHHIDIILPQLRCLHRIH